MFRFKSETQHIYLISEFLASEKPLWEHLSRSIIFSSIWKILPKVPAPTSQFGATRPYLDPAHRRRDIPPQFKHWLGSVLQGLTSFFSLWLKEEIRNHVSCESKQFLCVMNSQIGHVSLYFYKLHTQHEDTIDANITNNPSQASRNTLGHHLPQTKNRRRSRWQIKTQTTLGCSEISWDDMRCYGDVMMLWDDLQSHCQHLSLTPSRPVQWSLGVVGLPEGKGIWAVGFYFDHISSVFQFQ